MCPDDIGVIARDQVDVTVKSIIIFSAFCSPLNMMTEKRPTCFSPLWLRMLDLLPNTLFVNESILIYSHERKSLSDVTVVILVPVT